MEMNNQKKLKELCAIGSFSSKEEEKLITYLAETGNFYTEQIYKDLGLECALIYISSCNEHQWKEVEEKLKEYLGSLE